MSKAIVHLKYIRFLFVYHTSIKLENKINTITCMARICDLHCISVEQIYFNISILNAHFMKIESLSKNYIDVFLQFLQKTITDF